MDNSIKALETQLNKKQAPEHTRISERDFVALENRARGISSQDAHDAIVHFLHNPHTDARRKQTQISGLMKYLDKTHLSQVKYQIALFLADMPAPVETEKTFYETSSNIPPFLLASVATPGHVTVDVRVCDPAPESPEIAPISDGLRIDVHLCRLAMFAGLSRSMWLYEICHYVDDGSSNLSLHTLFDFMKTRGIYSNRVYTWLSTAHNKGFLSWDRHNHRVFLTSRAKLAAHLLEYVDFADWDLFTGADRPGRYKRVIIDVPITTKLSSWHATLFAAWFAMFGAHKMVANETLSRLWGVSVRQINYWKEDAGITHSKNYARDKRLHHVPAHAAKDHHGNWIWQLPNTYHTPGQVERHDAIGNRDKIRSQFDTRLEELGLNPASNGALSTGGELTRRYFIGNRKKDGYKLAEKWQSKHGAQFDTPLYVRAALVHKPRVGVWTYQGLPDVWNPR